MAKSLVPDIMEINYTTEQLDADFKVADGVSFTLKDRAVVLMAFVKINSAWCINGLSVEDRGDELCLSVLTSGTLCSPHKNTFKIKAIIEPVAVDWDGRVNVIVKEPYYA